MFLLHHKTNICRNLVTNIYTRKFQGSNDSDFNRTISHEINGLEGCALYQYKILASGNKGISNSPSFKTLYKGVLSTKISDTFLFEPVHFKVSQNSSYFGLQWHHTYACFDEYEISITSHDKINLRRVVSVPNIRSLTNESYLQGSVVTINLMETALKQDITFKQCSMVDASITPMLDNKESLRTLRSAFFYAPFERTLLYFTKPLPPNGLKMVNKDSHFFDITWIKEDCYEAYLINIFNSTFSWNQTFINDGNKDLKIANLHACTKYNLKIWSISDSIGMSEDHSYLTVYTEHPEDIHISAVAAYNEITLNITLHGIDCLKHYAIYVCNEEKESKEECKKQEIQGGPESSLEFTDLMDGTLYSYELIGYDVNQSTVFKKPKQLIETKRIVIVKLNKIEIKDTSILLQMYSNIFEPPGEVAAPDLQFSALIVCTGNGNSSNSTIINIYNPVLVDTIPYSKYNCTGILNFERELYYSNRLEIQTKEGIPSMPKDLELVDTSSTEASIQWVPPSDLNGDHIIDYQIDILPKCKRDDMHWYCKTVCRESFSLHTNQTYINVKGLAPYNIYEVGISAKTKNPTYGPKSDEIIIIETHSSKSNPPRIEKVAETSEGKVIIDFSHDCPLTGFTDFKVHLKCMDEDDDRCYEKDTTVKQFIRGSRTIEVVGLDGGHLYDFFIVAKVEDCMGKKGNNCFTKSESKSFFKEGIPSEPIGMHLVELSPTEADIEWQEPSIFNGDSILDYLVEIMPLCEPQDLGYCDSECPDTVFLHTHRTHITAKNLLPFSSYDIKISAKTKHPSYGPKTKEELIIETPPAKPHPPAILNVEETIEGNLVINFEQGCPLTGKTVFEIQCDCEGGESGVPCTKDTSLQQYLRKNNTIELINLPGGRFYDLCLVAKVKNCGNNKPWKHGSTCATASKSLHVFKEGSPSSPTELKLVSVSPTHAHIEWKPPSIIQGDSVLDYMVEIVPGCKPKDEHNYCKPICLDSFFLHTSETQIRIDKLHPYNTYEINVSARTKCPIYGPQADTDLIVSTPPAKPEKPKIVKAYQTSAGSLMVHFKYICPLTGDTDFQINWSCQAGSTKSSCRNATNVKQYLHGNDRLEIVGLDGGHFYDVTLVAKVSHCWKKDGDECIAKSKSKIVFLGNSY